MADNNLNQSVTLDASQFIAATQQIATSVESMNKAMQSAATAFTNFNNTIGNIDARLSQLTTAMQSNALSMQQMAAGLQSVSAGQNQMLGSLNAIAISARASAVSLDQLANSAKKTGQDAAAGGQSFLLSWTSVFRLLAVTAIRRVFLDIVSGVRQAVSAAAEYQTTIGNMIALNGQLAASVDSLGQKFAQTASQFNRPLNDVAQSAQTAVQTGVAQTADQVDQVTQAAARLSQIAGTTAPQAMNVLTAAMQAFRQPAEQAGTTANQLFHIIQSGVSIQDIQSSFGRVAAQAQRLGISFEEVGQFMEALKSTGISSSEVMTQVSAVFNSLERPTTQLNNLFKENGLQTGQQAISAMRLVGVLQLLNKTTDEGTASQRQLVQSRRAGGGLSVGEQLQQQNPLQNLSGLNQTADAAQKNVAATTQWSEELNKVKVAFESEIAPAIMKSILEIFQTSGGLSKAIIDLGRNFAQLAPILAEIVNRFVVLGQGISIAADAIGLINGRIAESKAALDALGAAQRVNTEAFNQWAAEQRQISQQAVQSSSAAISDLFRPINQQLQAQSDQQRQNVDHLKENLAGAAKAIMSALGAQLSALESIARQAETQIEDSLKRVADFAEKTDREAFQRRLKTAGEVSQQSPFNTQSKQGQQQARNAFNLVNAQNAASENQANLIRSRQARLQDEIVQLQQKGDQASIESARRKFEELRALNDQLADNQAATSRRTAEFNARSTGRNQQFNPFNTEREAGASAINAQEAAFEEQNRQRLRERAALIDDITKKLREQMTVAEQASRALQSFRVTDQTGNLEQRFQGPQGRNAALNEFDSRAEQARNTLQTAIDNASRQISELLRNGTISQDQADRMRRSGPNEDSMRQLVQSQDALREGMTQQFDTAARAADVRQLQTQANAWLQQIAKNTEQALQRSNNERQNQNSLLEGAQRDVNSIRNIIPGNSETGAMSELARQLASQLREQVGQADRALQQAQRSGGQNDIGQAIEAVNRVANTFSDLSRERGLQGRNEGVDGLRDILRRLNDSVDRRQNADNAAVGERQTGQDIANSVRTAIGNPQNLQDAAAAAQALGTALRSGEFPTAIGNVANQLTGTLIPAIQAASQALQNARGGGGNGGGNGNDSDEGFALGGLIGNRFSSFGPDNVNINARRGEFVVNPESTRRFYSSLVAINRGDNPSGRGYSRGGTVTNTIGNMTFHVHGAEKPEQTAREVMKHIRREQRRGNV